MYHHLALLTDRVYVYQPLVWQPRRASLPLSAFLSGVTTGTIPEATFEHVCPPSEVNHVFLNAGNDAIWNHARDLLSGPDRCIVVDNHFLSWTFLASSAVHPVWPLFKMYLSSTFKWFGPILLSKFILIRHFPKVFSDLKHD